MDRSWVTVFRHLQTTSVSQSHTSGEPTSRNTRQETGNTLRCWFGNKISILKFESDVRCAMTWGEGYQNQYGKVSLSCEELLLLPCWSRSGLHPIRQVSTISQPLFLEARWYLAVLVSALFCVFWVGLVWGGCSRSLNLHTPRMLWCYVLTHCMLGRC